ncbi:serine peptidase [Streptomyces sp. NPDC102340]|uniref:serine peptidase n=1 Tax=unclassified Streptomyces TaxID=2593676 RepID=UPI002E269DBA
MTNMVAVHGVGHYAPAHSPAEIVTARSAAWTQQLAAGLGAPTERISLTYAYYAHHLHAGRPIAQGTDDLKLLEREYPHAAIDIALWAASLDESLRLDLPPVTAQGRLAVPLRQLISVVSERLSLDGRLTRAFIAAVFRDVTRYLGPGSGPIRTAAREEVADTIASTGARVVIAHSLGSVVAYEALHAHPELEVDLLLTLGSPLALRHGVFDRLAPAPVNGIGDRPPGVRRWVNLCDHGDIVAVPRPLKQRFPTVDLDLTDSIAPFDFHSAAPYLRSASVAATLAPFLAEPR